MAAIEIVEVSGGIWSVRRGPRWRAAYIVRTSPGAVLIDTGPEPSGATVMQAFQEARVGLRSVRAILLTSSDADAAAAAPALRDRCGTRVLASPEAALRLRPFAVDGTIEPGQMVEDRFEVLEGDSPGSLAYRFRPIGALFAEGRFQISGDRTSSLRR
jgi:glyoxylase-like metal-dependent hydrolase (beta-lactamase superfamily II)